MPRKIKSLKILTHHMQSLDTWSVKSCCQLIMHDYEEIFLLECLHNRSRSASNLSGVLWQPVILLQGHAGAAGGLYKEVIDKSIIYSNYDMPCTEH